MELKIKDRDYVADGAGGLVRVSGWDELLERVLFKLSVRRGSFALAPELGSKLHLLAFWSCVCCCAMRTKRARRS